MAKGAMKYFDETTQSWVPLPSAGNGSGGASLTKTTLWEGAATIAAESSGGSIPLAFTPSNYDYYDVYVSYGGYGLGETAVRCYPVKSYSGSDAISGRLIWNSMYWLQLDVYIQATGGVLLGCIYRSPGSTSFTSGENSFTISKVVGYKFT